MSEPDPIRTKIDRKKLNAALLAWIDSSDTFSDKDKKYLKRKAKKNLLPSLDAESDLEKDFASIAYFILLPGAIGGFSSFCLRLISSEREFLDEDAPDREASEGEASEGEAPDEDAPDEDVPDGEAENSLFSASSFSSNRYLESLQSQVSTAETPTGSSVDVNSSLPTPKLVHNFLEAVNFWQILEFSLLIGASIVLGMVVSYIGSILTVGKPEPSNRYRVAATAILIALFFPNVVVLLERYTEAQVALQTVDTRLEAQEEAIEAKDEEAATANARAESAQKENIGLLEQADSVAVNPPTDDELKEFRNTNFEQARNLVIDSNSDQVALSGLESMHTIAIRGGVDTTIAVRAFREIANSINPTFSDEVKETALQYALELEINELR
mgnify:CR=1 FL=1